VLTKIVHEDARRFIKALCEATEGKPMQWRTIIGLSAKQAAVDYAIEKGLDTRRGWAQRVPDRGRQVKGGHSCRLRGVLEVCGVGRESGFTCVCLGAPPSYPSQDLAFARPAA